MSIRHACLSGAGYPHTRGSGKGPVKCKHCKGPVYATEGRWGVYVWTADGRYVQREPVKVYQSEKAAQCYADATDLVVRWIPA